MTGGVGFRRTPNSGLGIVAQRDLKVLNKQHVANYDKTKQDL